MKLTYTQKLLVVKDCEQFGVTFTARKWLLSIKGGYYFDVISGKYATLFKALDIPIPEAKHKYDADKDDFISDEDLIAEYENEDIKNILGEEL